MLIISESLKNAYSGGLIGAILFKNAINSELSQSLEKKKEELESTLRNHYENFNRSDLCLIEPNILLNGQEKKLIPGDMMIDGN